MSRVAVSRIGVVLLVSLVFSSVPLPAIGVGAPDSLVFINEFHYDNAGEDAGEFVEIAGPEGTDLSGWQVVLYNGNGGVVYGTVDLDGPIGPERVVAVAIPGLQNGPVEGLALVQDGAVVQLLSYGGVMVANDGPAAGLTSTDIGVTEDAGATPASHSLQLSGTGAYAGDFAWQPPAEATPGAVNSGQMLTAPTDPAPTPDPIDPRPTADGASSAVFVNELHYDNDGGDTGEFIEIAAPPNTSLSGWQLVAYNGNGGAVTDTIALSGTVDADGALDVQLADGTLQNGGADGVALLIQSTVVQLLSWEGVFAANDGPASGMTSTDIGVAEPGDTPVGQSLQLTGTGEVAGDFAWTGPASASPGVLNDGQTLTADPVDPGEVEPDTSGPVEALLPGSDPVGEIVVPGESLADSAVGTEVTVEESCCGRVFNGDQQLRVDATAVGDTVDLTLDIPTDGTWQLAVDLATGPSYGEVAIGLDDAELGTFDGYTSEPGVARRVVLGVRDLAGGEHTLQLTVSGRPAGATGVLVGLDQLRLRRQPLDGRLALSPSDGAAVRGLLATYGWTNDPGDTLSLTVDGTAVPDRPALAEGAILLVDGDGIQAGPSGADFNVGAIVRGQEFFIGRDVSGFATDAISIPGELLTAGSNEITYTTGPDPALGPDSNQDNFTIRNVRLQLPDGSVVQDSEMTGSFDLQDNNPTAAFTFDIPASITTPARGYVWDTTGVSDGPHTVTLTADGPTGPVSTTHSVLVDNTVPAIISTTPADGSLLNGTAVLDVVIDDGDAPSPPDVTVTLDGSPVELGATLDSDALVDGRHTLVVTATDAAGNTATRTVEFRSVAQTPNQPTVVAPEPFATDQPFDGVDLQVRASDPAGDDLEVTFLAARPVAGPPMAATGGASAQPPTTLETAGGTPLDVALVAAPDGSSAPAPVTADFPYQRFDVQIDEPDPTMSVDLRWQGTIAADRELVLSAWDVTAQSWIEVAASLGEPRGDTTVAGDIELDRVLDGDVVHVLVHARDPFIDEPDLVPDFAFEDPEDYDFSIAWMTDTQYLSEGVVEGRPQFGEAYRAINEWIVDNAETRKIAYTAHTGDIINNWITIDDDSPEYLARAREEFQFARDTMDVLAEGQMPFGVIPGNHDNRFGTTNELYNEYFSPEYFSDLSAAAPAGEDGQGYYGGPWRDGDNQNHYDLVEAGGEELIFVYLGFIAGQEELDWANEVLAEYSDRKAVFLTHEYLLPSGDRDGRGGALSDENERSQGQELFEQVVLPNANVFLTLSGHTHGVALNIKRDVGIEGRTVVEMLANYQFYEIEGERRTGHFRLLQFDLDESTMSVNTYSPVLDDHNAYEYDTQAGRNYTPSADEFVVPVDLASRTTTFSTNALTLALRTDQVIGTTSIGSGEIATVTWEGLRRRTTYAWYARAVDDTGAFAESSVATFTTARNRGRGRGSGGNR